jgi:hypothetical protein
MNQAADAVPSQRPSRGAVTATERYEPPYLAAGIAAVAVWLLYAATLAPTTAFWDTSEYITTGHMVGINHPPGNPLFVVLARGWDVLLSWTGLSVAMRVNLFSATMGALAHGCWFLLAHRVLGFFSQDKVFRIVGASVAVLISATAFTVWNQSNVNEKVYTVSLFTIALLSWLAFKWRDDLGRGKDDNLILLMVFILALSVANHLMAFLAAPALLVFIVIIAPRTLANWKLYAGVLVVAILGLSVHLFLPLRAALHPVINEADPTCNSVGSALGSILTFGKAGCQALSESLQRKQYDKPSIFLNPLDPQMPRGISLMVAQAGNYLQYFDWQWARSVAGKHSWFGAPRPLFTLLFLAIGSYGSWRHYKTDRPSWLYVAVLFLTLSLGLAFYMNFKYGFSFPFAEGARQLEAREVRERDYFFIVSFSLWGLWSGIGLASIWQRTASRIVNTERGSRQLLFMTSPVLAFALLPLLLNWNWASRRHDYVTRDWAYNLLMSVEPYGVLFTNGDNDTFPLWYAQEVEGVRRDVTVIVMSYLNTPWYAKQIRDLTTPCKPGQSPDEDPTRIICQRPFKPVPSAPFYNVQQPLHTDANRVLPKVLETGMRPPTHSIIPFDDAKIEEIAATPAFVVQEPLMVQASQIQSTITSGKVLIPADIFMTAILKNSIDERPIFYATTTQAYEDLNLTSFLIRQGVAFKLHNGPVREDPAHGIYQMPDNAMSAVMGRYINLPRTDSLLWNVFAHSNGFPDKWNHWSDAATQGIPLFYAYAHYAAAQAHAELGQQQEVTRHVARADAWIALANK